MSLIEPRYRTLYIGLFGNFVVYGIGMTIIGATLPKILADFSWSYTAAGAVLAAGSLGYFISTYLSGMLLQRLGPRVVAAGGLVVQAISLAVFALVPSIVVNFIIYFIMGLGQGGTEVTINYAVVRMERKGESHLMSIIHAAFSVGAVIGPLIIGLIIRMGFSWQLLYRGLGAVTLVMAVILAILPFGRLTLSNVETPEMRASLARPERQPMFYLAFFLLLVYVGVELGSSNWVSEYFVTILGSTPSVGAFMVSIFWIGLLVGRVGVPVVFRRAAHAKVLTGLALFTTLSLAGALLFRNPVVVGAGFFFTGLGCSAIYPLIMTIIGHFFDEGQNRAIGFAAAGGGVGSLVFPFIMAAVSQGFGLRTGFLLYVFMALVMSGISFAVLVQIRKKKVAA
ncbi:MAG TPA: MFS transporter [Spirochaetia bacterium]|nr:MFS transporter [Spirochaetia bacterium]